MKHSVLQAVKYFMFVRQYLLISEERQNFCFVELYIKQYRKAMASGTFSYQLHNHDKLRQNKGQSVNS